MDHHVHDKAAEAIDKLLSDYGNTWPPKSDFEDWPASWSLYVEICDEMPARFCQNKDTATFRAWMEARLDQVDLDAVMIDVEAHLRKDDQKLTGFSACLFFLKNSYRWGAVPAPKEEHKRTSMTFPEKLELPVQKIASLHGITPCTCYFTLVFANIIYENGRPARTRFCFNTDPAVLESENSFFLPATYMEQLFEGVLRSARDYLVLTAEAKMSTAEAVRCLNRREEHLINIHKGMVNIFKEFKFYVNWTYDQFVHWNEYFDPPVIWGLDGCPGASGAETFILNFLDEFLHVPGKGFMYNYKEVQYKKMATSILEVLDAVRIDDPSERFRSFVEGGPQEDDPLWKLRDNILGTIHTWRLSHARVAGRALVSTDEPIMEGDETLGAVTEQRLIERARETLDEKNKTYE